MEEYHPMTMISSPPLDPYAVCFQPTAVAHFLPVVTVDDRCFQYLYSSPPPACLPHQLFAHPPEFLHAPPLVYYYYYYSPPPPPPPPSAVHDEKRMMSSSVRVKKWIPKNRLMIRNSERQISQKAIKEVKANLSSRTTLMIKNIPNQLKREDLQRLLDDHCMVENKICRSKKGSSAYDFLYLPMDFVFKLNLGYAFVNFTTPEAAARFFIRANKFEWSHEGKTKICEICVADYQGKHAVKKRFKNSVFECDSEEYLPAVYSPPRDGSVRSPPVTLGRCTGRPPARQRGSMVMPWRKLRFGLN